MSSLRSPSDQNTPRGGAYIIVFKFRELLLVSLCLTSHYLKLYESLQLYNVIYWLSYVRLFGANCTLFFNLCIHMMYHITIHVSMALISYKLTTVLIPGKVNTRQEHFCRLLNWYYCKSIAHRLLSTLISTSNKYVLYEVTIPSLKFKS